MVSGWVSRGWLGWREAGGGWGSRSRGGGRGWGGKKGLGTQSPESRVGRGVWGGSGLLGPRPGLHLARSFPGDFPCSSTSPRGQVRVRCELGREQLEALSWAPPTSAPSSRDPHKPLPRSYLPPPVRPRGAARAGRSDELRPPSPAGLTATPSPAPCRPPQLQTTL